LSPGAPRALITGIAGQDGSYLAELLLAEGVEVHGVVRTAGGRRPDGVTLHVADVTTPGALAAIVAAVVPDEIHHLASPTFVPDSWADPQGTMAAIAGPVAELIGAVRADAPATRVVYACSREIFGPDAPSPQREDTACAPASPYGEAKLAAHRLIGAARERDGLHLSSAILFNHESPRRPPQFVARRVTRAAARISLGLQQRLTLGDLDAVRDWSAARDIVAGLRLMAAAPAPGDYVLASGVGRTVRELAAVAFGAVGLDAASLIDVEQGLVRPREPSPPVGDSSKARRELRWEPRMSFEELIAEMVAADVAATRS
jgi:GDPmannose 4,6-dehydratase